MDLQEICSWCPCWWVDFGQDQESWSTVWRGWSGESQSCVNLKTTSSATQDISYVTCHRWQATHGSVACDVRLVPARTSNYTRIKEHLPNYKVFRYIRTLFCFCIIKLGIRKIWRFAHTANNQVNYAQFYMYYLQRKKTPDFDRLFLLSVQH